MDTQGCDEPSPNERPQTLAEQNGRSLAFREGYIDGETSRRLGKRLALGALVGIDERSIGFRAGYFERQNRDSTRAGVLDAGNVSRPDDRDGARGSTHAKPTTASAYLPNQERGDMKAKDSPDAISLNSQSGQALDVAIAQLVGQIYETAPAIERCRMLEQLMKPLGVLSLVAIANGVFAKIWFRSGWHDLHIRPEDAQRVQASDGMALVQYVEQASIETVDGLAQIVAAWPVMAGSAVVALLVTALARRARSRAGHRRVDDPPGTKP
jgi:hypothetical protein